MSSTSGRFNRSNVVVLVGFAALCLALMAWGLWRSHNTTEPSTATGAATNTAAPGASPTPASPSEGSGSAATGPTPDQIARYIDLRYSFDSAVTTAQRVEQLKPLVDGALLGTVAPDLDARAQAAQLRAMAPLQALVVRTGEAGQETPSQSIIDVTIGYGPASTGDETRVLTWKPEGSNWVVVNDRAAT